MTSSRIALLAGLAFVSLVGCTSPGDADNLKLMPGYCHDWIDQTVVTDARYLGDERASVVSPGHYSVTGTYAVPATYSVPDAVAPGWTRPITYTCTAHDDGTNIVRDNISTS